MKIEDITYGKEKRLPGLEADLQKSCANYLRWKKVFFFHPPNGGYRLKSTGGRLKSEGVIAGVSDLVILEPRGAYHGLMIELKVGRNTLSLAQIDYLRKCWKKGYSVAVCYNFDAFKKVVDKYLDL